jgi:hypothetical protein
VVVLDCVLQQQLLLAIRGVVDRGGHRQPVYFVALEDVHFVTTQTLDSAARPQNQIELVPHLRVRELTACDLYPFVLLFDLNVSFFSLLHVLEHGLVAVADIEGKPIALLVADHFILAVPFILYLIPPPYIFNHELELSSELSDAVWISNLQPLEAPCLFEYFARLLRDVLLRIPDAVDYF